MTELMDLTKNDARALSVREKWMNFTLQARNCVLKTRNFVLKMMNFADADLVTTSEHWGRGKVRVL